MKGDVIELYGGNVRVVMGSLTQKELEEAVKRFIYNVEKERYEKEFIRNQSEKMVTNN